MKRAAHYRSSPGLTLIELVTSITVIGIMVVGLSLGVRSILYHYQHDSVLLEVRQYGQSVMRPKTRRTAGTPAVCGGDLES